MGLTDSKTWPQQHWAWVTLRGLDSIVHLYYDSFTLASGTLGHLTLLEFAAAEQPGLPIGLALQPV